MRSDVRSDLYQTQLGKMATLQPLKTKPESLTQMVYGAIREAIVSKEIAPGTSVSEASPARDLQVSKTPVREALLRLQSVGLIDTDVNRSARGVSPSRETIEQAYEIRGVLEAGAARMAAERATPDQGQGILAAAIKSRDSAAAGDAFGFRHWDGVFHLLEVDATQNPRWVVLVENALSLTSVLRQSDAPARTNATKCGTQHIGIAEAIVEGMAVVAGERAAQHALDVQRMVVRGSTSNPETEGNERWS